jgi:hypothetical protein
MQVITKLKKIFKSESTWFLLGLLGLMIYAFIRIQAFYQVQLKGTKMQELRTIKMDSP